MIVTKTENFIVGNRIVKRYFQGEKIVHEEIICKMRLTSDKAHKNVSRLFF